MRAIVWAVVVLAIVVGAASWWLGPGWNLGQAMDRAATPLAQMPAAATAVAMMPTAASRPSAGTPTAPSVPAPTTTPEPGTQVITATEGDVNDYLSTAAFGQELANTPFGTITIDDIVASIPLPHYDTSSRDHSLRSQVLAVAGTNPILRSRLAESLRTRRLMLNTLLDDVQSRLPADTPLNRDVITVLIFNLNWQYNDLMGDWAVSNEEYTSLLRHLLVNRRNK